MTLRCIESTPKLFSALFYERRATFLPCLFKVFDLNDPENEHSKLKQPFSLFSLKKYPNNQKIRNSVHLYRSTKEQHSYESKYIQSIQLHVHSKVIDQLTKFTYLC